jgi:uncharacterized SAM-binding protein YcdF (DUF218 family)
MRILATFGALYARRARLDGAFARAAGWLLGVLILCNTLGELLLRGFAVDQIWARSATLVPGWRAAAVLLALTLLTPDRVLARRPGLRTAGTAAAAGFAAAALVDTLAFYGLLGAGLIRSGLPLPVSALVAWLLGAAALRLWRTRAAAPPAPARRVLAPLAAAAVVALLALVLGYGATDYARPADAAVVLGARAYADGTPSLSLYDRTMAGVDLYRRGLVSTLVVSGGVEAHGRGVSEAAVMRRVALAAGVPDAAIVVDEHGDDSWATVRNARALARARGWQRVILVSHYYHLARLRLAADRAGLAAVTVPCRQTRRLSGEPWSIVREWLGLGGYYLVHLPAPA